MRDGLPEPGDVIGGKYRVERPLGRGGMGAVFVVAHEVTGKRMAIKCLLPELTDNADIVERFLREAQAMGRIQHRHVVDVFDVGRDGQLLYIVMELLEGKSFASLLHDETLTLEETLGILIRAMEGVAAAHTHGIIHRDLKPDNVFVCLGNSGRLDDPKVLDFGISKLEDDAGRPLTRSGVAMGTPYYMSLEQMSGNRDLDERVDVYAMGVILYEAIAGQPPHVADSVGALAIRLLTTPAIHLAQLRPDLPEGLADVVMKAIARDRDQRYQSMQELIDALRPFLPRGMGLLVPEGQGRPLRTPRDGKATTPASQATLPAGTVTPSAPTVAAKETPLQRSTPERSTPALTPVTDSGPKPSDNTRWVGIGGVLVLVLLALAVYGYWSLAGTGQASQESRVPRVPAPPALPAPTKAAASAQIPSAPVHNEPANQLPSGRSAGQMGSEESSEPASGTRASTPRRARVKTSEAQGTDAPSTGSAQGSEVTPQSATKVRGRAGELAPDDF